MEQNKLMEEEWYVVNGRKGILIKCVSTFLLYEHDLLLDSLGNDELFPTGIHKQQFKRYQLVKFG